ncbi:hypothetical protein F4679DRAFT_587158 [Xylaria curta]|nr:hypothetical protein F4679DRAFT_587158 [Xylaria curta]
MQASTYLSILIALAGIVSSAPAPADGSMISVADNQPPKTGLAITKRGQGRFKPVWVVGFDEDEEKGEHIGFKLFSEGKEDEPPREEDMKPHNGHAKAHDDHESSFWYYYYTY